MQLLKIVVDDSSFFVCLFFIYVPALLPKIVFRYFYVFVLFYLASYLCFPFFFFKYILKSYSEDTYDETKNIKSVYLPIFSIAGNINDFLSS